MHTNPGLSGEAIKQALFLLAQGLLSMAWMLVLSLILRPSLLALLALFILWMLGFHAWRRHHLVS